MSPAPCGAFAGQACFSSCEGCFIWEPPRVAPPFGRRLLARYRRAAALWGGHDLVVTKLVVVEARRRLIYTNLTDDAHVVSIFIVDEDEADALLRWVGRAFALRSTSRSP